jgi:hypothetical protein
VEDGVEATAVSVGGMGCEHVTRGWLSSVKDGVEAAGGLAVQYDSFLPIVLIKTVLKTSYGDLLYRAPLRAQWTIIMSTIPKRKHKLSDIEANYRNKTKTF